MPVIDGRQPGTPGWLTPKHQQWSSHNTVTRKIARPLGPGTAKEIIADLSRWYVHAPAAGDVLAAVSIHRSGISFWDAMIVRSAAETGCTALTSEDLNAGQEYSGVRVENPFQPPAADPG